MKLSRPLLGKSFQILKGSAGLGTLVLALMVCAVTAQTKSVTAKPTVSSRVGTSAANAESNPVPKAKNRLAAKKKIAETAPAEAPPITIPPLEERLFEQRQAVKRGEEREASSPYLIEEISVNGIYRSMEGYGAFLKMPNGRMFFAYLGMPFYDGVIAQITADQVIFEQQLANGQKKQIAKTYDPSALRGAASEKPPEKSRSEKAQQTPKEGGSSEKNSTKKSPNSPDANSDEDHE